ncbi:MAG TPA: DNA repair protein RecO [Burkholderiales bacterium]|nr:DNA repair protein RecO [Burkholderiales bacterium]
MRIQGQPGFVLHARDYSETSLIIEAFTPRHGRFGLLAKGARRPSSPFRGLLEPFQPLLLSWSGRGELPILTAVESDGETTLSTGPVLYYGFYLNELLVRLLHRHDPHEALYGAYRDALAALPRTAVAESVLRQFEVTLLGEIGYGLVLDRDVSDRTPIDADAWYDYIPERGPTRLVNPDVGRAQGIVVRGASLTALARNELSEPETLREAKRLMRTMLARYLGDKPLHSRKLFHRTTAPASSTVPETDE